MDGFEFILDMKKEADAAAAVSTPPQPTQQELQDQIQKQHESGLYQQQQLELQRLQAWEAQQKAAANAADPVPAEPVNVLDLFPSTVPDSQPQNKDSLDKDSKLDSLIKELETMIPKPVGATPGEGEVTTDDSIPLEAQEELINYAYDLEQENAELEDRLKKIGVELEAFRSERDITSQRANDYYKRLQEVEFDESRLPVKDELKNLVHFWNQNENASSPQSKQRVLAEAVNLVEQLTGRPLDLYLKDVYSLGVNLSESRGGAGFDIDVRPSTQKPTQSSAEQKAKAMMEYF